MRLVSPVTTESPKLKTITLSLSDLDGEISAGTSNQYRTFECPLDYDWYPIDKTKKKIYEVKSKSSKYVLLVYWPIDAGL